MAEPLRPVEYERSTDTIDGWPVNIVSYRLGSRFFCAIDNVDPGAVIARGQGTQRSEAEALARERAIAKLGTVNKNALAHLQVKVARLEQRFRAADEADDGSKASKA